MPRMLEGQVIDIDDPAFREALVDRSRWNEAWPQLIDLVFPDLRAFAGRIAGNTAAPESLATEAFSRLWQRMWGGRPIRSPLRPYLFRIVKNLVLSAYRQRRRRREVPALSHDDAEEGSPLAWVAMGIPHALIERFSGKASNRVRLAFLLRHGYGMSFEEIQQILPAFPSAAAVRAALWHLQNRIADSFGGEMPDELR